MPDGMCSKHLVFSCPLCAAEKSNPIAAAPPAVQQTSPQNEQPKLEPKPELQDPHALEIMTVAAEYAQAQEIVSSLVKKEDQLTEALAVTKEQREKAVEALSEKRTTLHLLTQVLMAKSE